MTRLTRIIIILLLIVLLGAGILYVMRFGTLLWTRGVPTLSSFPRQLDLLEQVPIRPGSRLIDLGCGTGKTLRHFADRGKDLELYGVDLNPLAIARANWRHRRQSYQSITLSHQDIWSTDLHGYDYIYVYLLPAVMPQLEEYLAEHMDEETIVICNTFDLPHRTPYHTIEHPDHESKIFLYRKAENK